MPGEQRAHENLKLVRLHYAAYACGDVDGLIESLDPQVCLEVHDEHGRTMREPLRGLDAARGFFEDIKRALTNTTVEIESLRADGDRVLARVKLGGTVRESGVSGVIPAVHLFTIHDGLIAEIRTHRPDWRQHSADAGATPA